MILTIWAILLSLSIIFLFYGYYSKIDAYKLIGSALLFICGTIIAPGINSISDTLQYKSGENISSYYKYGDNYTGYHWDYMNTPPNCPPNNLDCVKLFHTYDTKTNIYSTYENHTLGYLLSLIGILSFIIVMVDRRREGDK